MSKRQKFVLVTILISGLFFLNQLVLPDQRYLTTLGLIGFTGLVLSGLFYQIARRWSNIMAALFLPLSFLAGMSFFYFIIPQGWFWQLSLILFFAFGFYTSLLIENVFLVANEFKTVPLYRAAATSGFLLLLTSAFFLFDTVFSFHFSALINGLLIFFINLILWLHFFWATKLNYLWEKENLTMSFVFSLIIAEISVMISFWPVGVGKGSLYLVSLLYVFGGLSQAYCRQRLFKKTIWEFIWVGLGTFLALFLVTSWRGN